MENKTKQSNKQNKTKQKHEHSDWKPKIQCQIYRLFTVLFLQTQNRESLLFVSVVKVTEIIILMRGENKK